MTDLEERLRAAYHSVAEQTVVAAEHPPLHVVRPLEAASMTRLAHTARRRSVIGLATAACLLAVVVVVLITRHPAQPAGGTGDRTVAVPTYIPTGFAYYQAGASTAGGVWGFSGTFDTHVLEYRRGAASFVLSSALAEGVTPGAGDHTVELLSGVVAMVAIDPDITSIAWAQPNGPIVSVRGSGMTEAELLDVANSLWYVTPTVFDQLNRYAGFLPPDEAGRLADRWRIPGDRFDGSDAALRGSLQTGVWAFVFDGTVGFSGVPSECLAQALDNDGRVVLLGPGTTAEFRLTLPDGRVLTVPAATHPGLPTMAFGAVQVPPPLPHGSWPQGTDSAECVRGVS